MESAKDVKKQSFLETYTIKEKIGEGSGGTVILAYHKNLQKDVVLKRIHEKATEVLSKRAETDALKNLRHPYIPQVLDFIELEDGIYTVMDYIPGTTFDKLLNQGRQFSQKEVIKYARQLFEVLDYIHSRNPKIIHGDIKPDNLILTPDDNICLIDFNISGTADESGAMIEGFTSAYASPEQVEVYKKIQDELNRLLNQTGQTDSLSLNNKEEGYKPTEILMQSTELLPQSQMEIEHLSESDSSAPGNSPSSSTSGTELSNALTIIRQRNVASLKIDERADIYSAAATIYHILTGKIPRIEDGVVIQPNKIIGNMSEGLNYILMRALEQNPDKRFSSASDVLKALNEIGKFDSRYKRLTRRQNGLFVVAVAFICLGAVLINAGKNISKIDAVNRYDENIAAMEEMIGDTSKNEEFEQLYLESINISKNQIDAYLYYSLNLFTQKRYEEVIRYINEGVLENGNLLKQSGIESLYYMLGSSYFRMEDPDYEDAISSYSTAIMYGNDQASCYRELAECYLALNQISQAEEVLENAQSVGASSEDMILLTGEIAASKGNVDTSIKYYKECIASAEDDEVMLRAYLGWNDSLLMSGKTEDSLLEAVEVLENAQTDLPISSQVQILQSQIQNYIDLYSITGDDNYAKRGIETIDKAISDGWVNYGNYLNEAFLYEQIKDFSKAEEILINLADNYPNYYSTYLRLAFLEADMQNSESNISQRNYSSFDDYYHKAKELYDNLNQQTGDMEMQLLEQMHDDAVQNGWIVK